MPTEKIKRNLNKKKKQNGGDAVCSNLYPKMDTSHNLNMSNEIIGGPMSVNSNNKTLSCSLPTPRPPIGDIPASPILEKMPMNGTPSIFKGEVPSRVPPKIPGPPGPGNYQLGPEGIYVSSLNDTLPQATSILQDLVNRGTKNRDYQPILNTNLVTKSTCKSSPNNRHQSGGAFKKKSFKKTPIKILKSQKLLKEREQKLDTEKEKQFIIGIKRELTIKDFKKVLSSLDINYSNDMNIQQLYQLLKKERPELVRGTGWFYLLEIMKACGLSILYAGFISILLMSVPITLISSLIDSGKTRNKTKKKIKKIIDSK